MINSSTIGSDGWIRLVAVVVPIRIRRQFLGELREDRGEMQQRGDASWRIRLRTIATLFVGLVQNVPLVESCGVTEKPSAKAERAAAFGWVFWRASGPMLFAGYALSVPALVLAGAIALVGSFICVGMVIAISDEVYGDESVRTLNAVFGGLATVLALVVVAGALTGLLLGLSAIFGAVGLGVFAMKALVFVSTLVCGIICIAGWVPREWEPTRMIRQ